MKPPRPASIRFLVLVSSFGFLSCCSTIAAAAGLPRGLIVQIGGDLPPAGEGRVIDYLDVAPVRLPYADNTVRYLVSERPVAEEEVLRVLRPLGTARLKNESSWREITKPWPSEIDEWTHWLHGPGSNPVAADQRVGVPRRLLWTATPRRSRSHEKSPSLTGMVSARGRLFYICDEAPVSVGGRIPDRWRLVARDAFSGALLWKKDIADWGWQAWSPTEPMNLRWGNPRFIHRRLVAVGDRVYVTLGYSAPISVLDAETGRVVRVLEGTENTAEIVVHQDTLIASISTEPKTSVDRSPALKLMAVDPKSGNMLWQTEPMPSQADYSQRGKAATLKQGRLLIAADADFVAVATPAELLAFNLADGTLRWRVPATCRNQLCSLIAYRGDVYYGPVNNQGERVLICVDGVSGKQRWQAPGTDWSYGTSLNSYLIGDQLVTRNAQAASKRNAEILFLDTKTGKETRRIDASATNSQHHHRCYRNKATENFILMGAEGVECVDLRSGKVTVNRWVRGACLYGIMPANGLIYFTPEACACNLMNRLDGYGALGPESPMAAPLHPLIKGPAYDEPLDIRDSTDATSAWPQYRKDDLRSNSVDITPSAGEGWKTTLGGRLTAPTSDDARLYLGHDDEVVAIDCEDGSVAWRVAGRIDSPPSLYRGRAIYGTRDGWVHCRIADTGELAWSFHAAPEQRLILDDNHLESVWPVHGSALVFRNTIYVVAGRSSFLDGGLRLFALDPGTGAIKASSTLSTEQTIQRDYYEGVNSDILATDGERIFLKHMRIDPDNLAVTRQQWWSFSGPDGKLKNYDKEPISLPAEETRTYELSCSAGFLDDQLFGRAHMQLDRAELCNRICFDAERSYGIRHSIGAGHFQFYIPGSGGFPVLCFDRAKQREEPRSGLKPSLMTDPMPGLKGSKLRGVAPTDHGLVWHCRLPLRPSAMIATGDRLIIGGGPDTLDSEDPLKSAEWRAGGVLSLLDRSDGTVVDTRQLPAPPVHEGVLAVRSGLYVCSKDGVVSRVAWP